MAGLKSNISANLVSQIYSAAVAVLTLPLLVRYMGAEAYGLVGFFSVTQAWFQLLDLGLSPTLSRQVARYRGGALDASDLRKFFSTAISFASILAAVGVLVIILFSGGIADHWLKAISLSRSDVAECIALMAVAVGIRFISSLMRSALSGFESFVLIGWVSSAIATLRFVLVIGIFFLWGVEPQKYFWYQIAVSILELLVLGVALRALMPKHVASKGRLVDFTLASREIKFAIGASATGLMWVVATQVDKMLLSSILPLDQYGFFTLCVSAANGITIVATPIGASVVPRLVKLRSENKYGEVVDLYRVSTQLAMVLIAPLVILLTLFAGPVLWMWTGNETLASTAGTTLALYSVGNAFLAASSFQYGMQVAHGKLGLHVVGNVLFIAVLIPGLYLLTYRYGMTGAALAWMLCNAAMFFLWIPVVHSKYMPGQHVSWCLRDVLRIYMGPVLVGLLVWHYVSWPNHRTAAVAQAGALSVLVLSLAIVSSSQGRKLFRTRILRASA